MIEIIKAAVMKKFEHHPSRLKHILGVVDLATDLALKFGLSIEEAQIAAYLHDYAKYDSIESQIASIDDEAIIRKYQDVPVLYHAYAAGSILKNEFGIDNPAIYNAIVSHVWGRPNMDKLEQILVVADFCEASRTYPACIEAREALKRDFHEALYLSLQFPIEHLLRQGIVPHDEQLKARDYYKQGGHYMTLLQTIVNALDDVKCEDITVYDFHQRSPLFDYFIIATASNERQANAAMTHIKEDMFLYGYEVKNIEGKSGGWVLIDCKDIVVNVFSKEQRDHYGLDKLLLDIPRLNPADIIKK